MRDIPDCPSEVTRPKPIRRSRTTAPEAKEVSVALEVVTPILGGAPVTRSLDQVEFIRPASVRGQLRFWWRALNGHRWPNNPRKLHEEEATLWGRAAVERKDERTRPQERLGRSQVDLQIRVDPAQVADWDDEEFHPRNTPGCYGLWPARGTREEVEAPRRMPGTRFTLHLSYPPASELAVWNAVRAWILFGGYGSRTRRGLGSLTVTADQATWLPAAPTGEALRALFEGDILAAAGAPLGDLPLLAGAGWVVGTPGASAEDAWLEALDGWLRDFRQGTRGKDPAREPGAGNRPSISNWPEPDKVRQLHPGPLTPHTPRHNAEPAWPRAGFGLPIQTQWQTRARDGGPPYREPADYQLQWCDRQQLRRIGRKDEFHDRLASPLIVKALPLADGRFAPCALWLYRGYPDGEVVVVRDKRGVPRSNADFDLLVAPGDTAHFAPLVDPAAQAAPPGLRLRTAFFTWLRSHGGTVVAP